MPRNEQTRMGVGEGVEFYMKLKRSGSAERPQEEYFQEEASISLLQPTVQHLLHCLTVAPARGWKWWLAMILNPVAVAALSTTPGDLKEQGLYLPVGKQEPKRRHVPIPPQAIPICSHG